MSVPIKAPASAWAMLVALGMIWGGAFMATKIATDSFEPFTLSAIRIWIGAAAILAYLFATGQSLPPLSGPGRRFWAFAVLVGFLANAMPFVALGWAQRHIPSSLAGVYMTTVPFFVLPLGHLFVPGENLTLRRVIGLCIGFVGVLVLIGPTIAGAGTGSIVVLAQLACLLTAIGYASGGVASKRAPQMGVIRFGAAALLAAAVMVTPVALILEAPFANAPQADALVAAIYLGLLPTGLATVMLLAVIDRAGPGFLSLVNYQVPVWAVIFGVVFLSEPLPGRLWAALALILIGLAVSQNLLALRRGGHARG